LIFSDAALAGSFSLPSESRFPPKAIAITMAYAVIRSYPRLIGVSSSAGVMVRGYVSI